MSEPKIVTPQEAQIALRSVSGRVSLAHTVATEPDRTRAAVVKALREVAARLRADDAAMYAKLAVTPGITWAPVPADVELDTQADAIEAGADF